jgi:hypothetical protein
MDDFGKKKSECVSLSWGSPEETPESSHTPVCMMGFSVSGKLASETLNDDNIMIAISYRRSSVLTR